MEEGSILLARSILTSQVFAHQIALKIWIWCLCKATYKVRFVTVKIGKGDTTVKLSPGQFIFGRFKAEEELGIDGSTIYKWMQKFAGPEYDMISIESNNQYSIITVCKWSDYQTEKTKKVTTKEQPSNSGVTTVEQPSNTNNKVYKDNKEYIYGTFYNNEILSSNQNENYLKVLRILHGENNVGIPLNSVLKMENQLSFEQYKKLQYLKDKFKFSFTEIFEDMENWKDLNKRKTIYNTFLTFAKKRNPSISLK